MKKISKPLVNLQNKLDRFFKFLFNTLILVFFLCMYGIYIATYGFQYSGNHIIANGYFIFSILLLIINYFLPNAAQSIAQFVALTFYIVFFAGAVVCLYLVIPGLISFFFSKYKVHTINEIIGFFTLFILSSTFLSGLAIYLIKMKPTFILNRIKTPDFIYIFYDRYVDNIIRFFYLIVLIISGVLSFIISFVPVFFDLKDAGGNPISFKDEPRLFIFLIILLQVIIHGQVIDVFKKISENTKIYVD